MNADALNLDMFMPKRPKTRADLIPMLDELQAELANIDAHLDAAFARCEAMADEHA